MPSKAAAWVWVALALAPPLPGCDSRRGCTGDRSDPTVAHDGGSPLLASRARDFGSPAIRLAGYEPTVAQESEVPSAELLVYLEADPQTGGAPLDVAFRTELDPPVENVRYAWDLGDGVFVEGASTQHHTFRTPGSYPVTVMVSAHREIASSTVEVDVRVEGVNVSLDADPDAGLVPLTVIFTASVEDDGRGPYRYEWEFGDGNRSRLRSPTYTYRVPGDYVVRLEVTNAARQVGRDAFEINAQAPHRSER